MEKLIDLAALAEQLGGEEWVYSRTSLHSRGYITGRGGRTIVQTTDGDVPANVCRFIQMADPATILAIAKAFQNLENENSELRQQRAGLAKEANDLEAKLAELAKQKPIGWLNDAYLGRGVIDGEVGEDDFGPGYIPIYRQPFNDVPAPAADLAELVPTVCDGKEQYAFEAYARSKGMDLSQHPLHYLFLDGKTNQARSAWRECLVYVHAAILRSIEEQTK